MAEGVTKQKNPTTAWPEVQGPPSTKGLVKGQPTIHSGMELHSGMCVCVLAVAFSCMGLRLNKVSLHSPDAGVHIAKPSLRAHTHSKMEFHSGMEQKSYLMKGCVAEGGN